MFFTTISAWKKMFFFSQSASWKRRDCATHWRERRGWDLVIFDWFVLSMRMQVILDSSFARPGSAPIWGGKKGEFRDWTTLCLHITAFSQTDLFLVLIYREFRPPQEPQWLITGTVLIFNWCHHFTGRSDALLMWGKPFFPLPMRYYVDRNWSIWRGQKPTEKSAGLETRRTNKELSEKRGFD